MVMYARMFRSRLNDRFQVSLLLGVRGHVNVSVSRDWDGHGRSVESCVLVDHASVGLAQARPNDGNAYGVSTAGPGGQVILVPWPFLFLTQGSLISLVHLVSIRRLFVAY